MKRINKNLIRAAKGISFLGASLFGLLMGLTFHPKKLQVEKVFNNVKAPILQKGQKIKVMSWNVRFMAGRDYVFFFDVEKMDGPDERPTANSITHTLKEVAALIKIEKPDFILLQEIDEGAKRTDYRDQLAELLKLLPKEYGSYVSSFYWKNRYLPHPRIRGATGLKLVTISKYKIERAVRHALPVIPADLVSEQFGLKRAVLETLMPVEGGRAIAVMNTHLDAFAYGSSTMAKQIQVLKELFEQKNLEKTDWLIGGDFNLLPPNVDLNSLAPEKRYLYKADSEIKVLFDEFKSAIPLKVLGGKTQSQYYSYQDTNYKNIRPDRTIDYIFHSDGIKVMNYAVRQKEAKKSSDHFPLVVEMRLPG